MLSRLLLVLVLALTAAMLALLSVGVVFAAPSNDDTLTVTTCDSEGIELSAEEKRTFELHNQTRSSYGLEPLCLDSALTQAAREHSQEMVDKGYFEHESYNGESTGERLKRFGYEWEVFAENIAWGTTASKSTPEYIFESWMKSSEHKASILDENLQEVGIGAHKGTSDTYSGAIVYTVDFATPTNTSGSAEAPATSEPGRTVELSDDGSPSADTSTADPGWCSASFDEIMVRTSRNVGDQPDSDEVRRLLNEPNFEGTPNAIDDLQKGIVDKLLIEALLTIVQKHQICVNTFKTGHQFIAGVIDGPFIPKEYGGDGSWPNTHYYGRAVDIFEVDHKAIQSNGLTENVLDVGKILASIQKEKRPDQVIGPTAWTQALEKTNGDDGWLVVDEWQTRLHEDHLHIGYETETQEG